MPPLGPAANQDSETQVLSQNINTSSHIKDVKLNKLCNCRGPCLGVNCFTYNRGVSNCSNTRSPHSDLDTSLTFSESNVTFDSNTSTNIVDSMCDNVACNGMINSPNDSCNISVYSDLTVINNYRSICSSDVSLASMPRRWGNSPPCF